MVIQKPKIALVDGFPDYEVDTEGNVFSLPTLQEFVGRWGPQTRKTQYRKLSPALTGGYLQVSLYREGQAHRRLVHRLVATAFIPNTEGLPEVNHIDECRSNNAVSNLEWVDRRGNAKHSCYKTTGSLNGVSKLDEAKVLDIKRLISGGYTNHEISARYGVHHSTVSKIRTGKNWSQIEYK